MKPFSSWLVLSTQGLSQQDDNSLSSLLSQLGHDGIGYPDLALQVRNRARTYMRQEAVRLVRHYTGSRLSRELGKWKAQSGLAAAALQYRKLRTYAVKLTREIKESQRVKVEIKSARTTESRIPVPRVATEKLSEERHRGRSISKDKENERTDIPKATEVKEVRMKRPISVQPKRQAEDSLLTKVQAEARNKVAKHSQCDSECIGQRLYQQAQEMEKRREVMRKSMEPEYSFTPQIAQSTEKWLLHKGMKGGKPQQDEVAVVSSSAALSFLNSNTTKEARGPLVFSTPKGKPLIPILCTNVLKMKATEDEGTLSKRYSEDCDSQNLSIVEYDPIVSEP